MCIYFLSFDERTFTIISITTHITITASAAATNINIVMPNPPTVNIVLLVIIFQNESFCLITRTLYSTVFPFSDVTVIVITFSPNSSFVSDTSKDLENIRKLQQLIQPAMQNGASLLEAAEILTNDNFNIIKQKLQEMQARLQTG